MSATSPEEIAFREEGQVTDLIACINPSSEDFEFTYLTDDNSPIKYSIRAGDSKVYPRYAVAHYAKHYIDKVLDDEGTPTNDAVKRAEIFGKIVLGKAGNVDQSVPSVPKGSDQPNDKFPPKPGEKVEPKIEKPKPKRKPAKKKTPKKMVKPEPIKDSPSGFAESIAKKNGGSTT